MFSLSETQNDAENDLKCGKAKVKVKNVKNS